MKRQKSILVVDDEKDLGYLLKSLLEEDYEEVVSCDSSIEAKSIVTERPFSLILTDITMPGLPGHEFVTHIRAIGRIEPVMFVTANADRDVLLAAIRLGVCDVIEKPFTASIILKAVERAIEIEKRRVALYENIFLDKSSKEIGDQQKRIIGLLQAANLKKAS